METYISASAASWNFYTRYNPEIVFPVGLAAPGSLQLCTLPYF